MRALCTPLHPSASRVHPSPTRRAHHARPAHPSTRTLHPRPYILHPTPHPYAAQAAARARGAVAARRSTDRTARPEPAAGV
eukprot:scaffold18211_cov60-Phaeocystis_antarctica.AAC.1